MRRTFALVFVVILAVLPVGTVMANCGFDCFTETQCKKCTPPEGRQQLVSICFEEGADGRITECFNGVITAGQCGQCFAP